MCFLSLSPPLPLSLLFSHWAGISWTSVLGKHSTTAPAPWGMKRDVGMEVGGREGKDGGENRKQESEKDRGREKKKKHETHTHTHTTQRTHTAVKTVKDSNMEVVRQVFE